MNRFGDIDVSCREGDTSSGFCEVHDHQPDDECSRCDNLEKDQRLQSHASNLFQRAGASDSSDNGGKDKGCDDRLDQVDENVAQKVNPVSPVWSEPADYCARHQADHDLDRERRTIPRAARWSSRNVQSHCRGLTQMLELKQLGFAILRSTGC